MFLRDLEKIFAELIKKRNDENITVIEDDEVFIGGGDVEDLRKIVVFMSDLKGRNINTDKALYEELNSMLENTNQENRYKSFCRFKNYW